MRSFKSASAGNDGDAFHGAGYGLKKSSYSFKRKRGHHVIVHSGNKGSQDKRAQAIELSQRSMAL